MSRLQFIVLSTILLAVRPVAARSTAAQDPSAQASDKEMIAAAQTQIVACPKAGLPESVCRDAVLILGGYIGELRAAEQCLAKPCTVEAITSIFNDDRRLDEAESKLPEAARSDGTGRPLLRLSLLVTRRAAAALVLVDVTAKPPFRYDPPVDAPRAVEELCRDLPSSCADARAALAGASELDRRVAECKAKPCTFEQLDETALKAAKAMEHYDRVRGATSTLAVFSQVNNAQSRFALLLAQESKTRLSRIESGLGALDAGLDVLARGKNDVPPEALEAKVQQLTGLYREASLGQDRVMAMLYDKEGAAGPRAELNQAAAHLAASRSRLLALEVAHGFDASAVPTVADAAGFARSAKLRAMFTSHWSGNESPPLLDRRTIPGPAPLNGNAPPILAQAPSTVEMLKNLSSEDPLKRADARRRMGLSATVGNPSARAALVHAQQHGDTCAVVSQQQILTALHLLPMGDAIKQETALREEARTRGFFNEGTPTHYSADLLVDRGVLVTKQIGASLDALDAAVRRGGMVIAGVDARYLWNVPASHPLGHAIVVTGAEVDRWSGKTVGYYINDSGEDPPGRGRFIPVETFRKAWDAHTRSYAEVR